MKIRYLGNRQNILAKLPVGSPMFCPHPGYVLLLGIIIVYWRERQGSYYYDSYSTIMGVLQGWYYWYYYNSASAIMLAFWVQTLGNCNGGFCEFSAPKVCVCFVCYMSA